MMHMTRITKRSTFVLVATAATTLGSVAVGTVSAATDTTEPPDTASMGTEAEGTSAPPGAGSAAPDIAAFCDAELAAEAAMASEDPATLGPAFEALTAAAPEDISATVEEVITLAEGGTETPDFAAAYAAMVEYVAANCGFAELNVAASEYAFGGIPEEVPAGPTVINLENIGEQVHEIAIYRINDDVTLTIEELLALPEEEADAMVTFLGENFAFPGDAGHKVVDFTPGRHVALCFIPDGTTAENFEQMIAEEEGEEAEGSIPEGTMPEGSAAPTEGSAPAEGSAPGGEEHPPHFTLGMIQEFTVV
jgi:hypothetical protein